MRKFFIIILAFAAVLFLCCAEFPDIEFPSWEGEEISSSSAVSSSSEPGSSSSAPSSSSAVSSSSSELGRSSSAPSSSSAISSSSEPGSSSSAESSSSAVSSSSSEPGSSSSAPSSSSAVPSSSSCDDADKCGGKCYDKKTHFCSPADNLVYPLCDNLPYNTATYFCLSGERTPKCDGFPYEPWQFCLKEKGLIENRCGSVADGAEYNPVTEQCCGIGKYAIATQFCVGTATYDKCGGTVVFTPGTEQCCGNNKYTLATHYCHTDNQTYSCGSKPYNPSTQFCQAGTNEVKSLCGVETFTAAEFCSGGEVFGKCGGTVEYSPATEACCGSSKYTIASQFCYNSSSSKIGSFCGSNPQKSYDPDKYGCRSASGTSPNGIYLKVDISYESKNYKAVLIGSQTWMAENLNYNASGSKCYGDDTGGDSQDRCATYGRLYNWATAMANSASSSDNPSGVKGVCPNGWHIPSNAEWDELMTAVGGSSTAGQYLKATSGWYNCGTSGSGSNYLCEDAFGFSALPGGLGSFDGSFSDVGYGYWWSATAEYDASYAYYRGMGYYAYVNMYPSGKTHLFSVRCAQD